MRFLDRLSVRLSTLLVLAGFITLILGTGTLGLFANQSGRDAFEQLRRIQVEQSRALDQAYIASLRAQVAMDRAAQLMRVPSFDRPGPVIEQAEAHLDKARDAFQTFRAVAPLPGQSQSIETLASRFGSLVDTGLGLQLMLLQEGDVKGYASGLSRTTDMSEAFMESADAFAVESAQRGDAQAARFARLGDRLNLALGAALLLVLVAAALVFGGIQAGVLRPLRRIEAHFRRIAAGDLSSPVETRRQNEIGRLFRELESMRRALADSVSRMHHGSVRLSQGASQMSDGNQELATRTQQQAASLEQTAASLEELSATVTHNTDFVHQANALSRRAVDNAKQGDEGVLAVVATMTEIRQRASRIDEIVGLIDAIAFQTNILALNASVEAARAGEAGRGFAVVAGEVRHLASRSVDAAREIRRLSESVQASVGRGNALSEQARTDMTAIVEAIQSASELVDQVATASAEQQHGLAQIQQAMNQMETVTQKNRAMVARAGLTAEDLEEAVGQMQAFASRFTLPREMAQPVDSHMASTGRAKAESAASPQDASLEVLPA